MIIITLGFVAFILTSFFLFESPITSCWNDALNSNTSLTILGFLIIALLAADVILPTPSSIVSIAAAAIFGVFVGGILIFTGMSLCCLLGYYLGKSGHSLVKTNTQSNNNRSVNRWIKRWGGWTLLIGRPIPVMAETSIVMAGMIHFPFKRFLLLTIPANALIAIAYGALVFISGL